MKQNVQEALQSSVTFNFDNSAGAVAKKLCLLPGIYDTMKFEQDGTSKVAILSFSNPANLTNAGYPVDQVADDYNSDDSGQFVHVTGTTRTRYRDFLNTVQRLGIRVKKIIIQNKVSSADIFDQEIELSRTAVGAKGATRFIKLQNFVSVSAYDRSKIEMEFTDDAPLDLTPDMFVAMVVPAGAKFSMQFVFDA